MGIAFAIIYIPLYLLAVLISSFIAYKIIHKSDSSNKSRIIFLLVGFILSIILNLILLFIVSTYGEHSWKPFINQLAITLCGSLILGVSIYAVSYAFENKLRHILHSISAGALFSIYAIPWIALFLSVNYYNIINYSTFNQLCNDSSLVFVEEVPPARSVLLRTDKFASVTKEQQARISSFAKFILNQGKLDYIERPPSKKSKYYNKSKYERIHINKNQLQIEYITQPVDKFSAEYEIISNSLQLPIKKDRGIGGSRIEIRRMSDDKLIAYTQYYWDNKTFKACPRQVHSPIFVFSFIATALNINNPMTNLKENKINK